jgi:cytidine deaminase
MRTRSGRVFQAVHLEAFVGRVAVCAEAVAIGMGAADGDTDIETIVAVNRAGEVIAPCGMCRELISDYSPLAKVIVPGEAGPQIVAVAELLPNKYAR